MKAILEFELPADKENFDVSAKGMDWAEIVDQQIQVAQAFSNKGL